VVLMDSMMPMDGFQTFQVIRHDREECLLATLRSWLHR